MANSNLVQKIVDTNRRLYVKMTGEFDGTGQETSVIKVDASSLNLALNSNGYIMTSNTDPLSTYRVTPFRIVYHVSMASGHVKLYFDSSDGSDGTIVNLGNGWGDMGLEGAIFTSPLTANSNGDILLTTFGAAANDSYTIILDCRKDSRDYDAGQTADPAAFNKGAWALS